MGFFIIFICDMLENIIKSKFGKYLDSVEIKETNTSAIINKIAIKKDFQNSGIGTELMKTITDYADRVNLTLALEPSSDFGSDKNRLVQFYKRFGFKMNQGYHSSDLDYSMVRFPKLNESKLELKKLLRESLVTKSDSEARSYANFINFAKKLIGINDDIKVELVYERRPDITTTAYYNLDGFVVVYAKDRAFIDVCRSIAHELQHHKQNIDGRLQDVAKDGADGSEIENEANAVAGVVIRQYGKKFPIIYK